MWVEHMVINLWLPVTHLKQYPSHANWLSLMIASAIIVLSLTPLPQLPDVPGSDKTHHLIAYAALAIPAAIATPSRLWAFAVLYILMGGAIEIIQPYVNRYGEWLDFIANVSGVVIGSLIGLVASKLAKTQ
jgi:VanZ family protein